MSLIVHHLAQAAALLPADINIGPNDNGLPGIAALRTIVGAVMTVGLILSVLALHLRRGVGLRRQLLQPAPRLPRQARRADLLRGRRHHRRQRHPHQLLWTVGQTIS